MERVIGVRSHSVRSALAEARRQWGLKLSESREAVRSGGEDGLYRVTLATGDVVECTIAQRAVTTVQ